MDVSDVSGVAKVLYLYGPYAVLALFAYLAPRRTRLAWSSKWKENWYQCLVNAGVLDSSHPYFRAGGRMILRQMPAEELGGLKEQAELPPRVEEQIRREKKSIERQSVGDKTQPGSGR